MRAWLMEAYEGVDKMRLAEVESPKPGPGQALLSVNYTALHPADAFLTLAQYPAKPALPHILGRDGVGVVEAVGEGAGIVQVGQTVGILRCEAGVNVWGTLAEKVVIRIGA